MSTRPVLRLNFLEYLLLILQQSMREPPSESRFLLYPSFDCILSELDGTGYDSVRSFNAIQSVNPSLYSTNSSQPRVVAFRTSDTIGVLVSKSPELWEWPRLKLLYGP